jgi:cell envelope opacity-associated protein A
MADGSSKPISQVKAGDKVANAVPGQIPIKTLKIKVGVPVSQTHRQPLHP